MTRAKSDEEERRRRRRDGKKGTGKTRIRAGDTRVVAVAVAVQTGRDAGASHGAGVAASRLVA